MDKFPTYSSGVVGDKITNIVALRFERTWHVVKVIGLEFPDLAHELELLRMLLTSLFGLCSHGARCLASRAWSEKLLMVLDYKISDLSLHFKDLLSRCLVSENLAGISGWLVGEL